MKTGTIYEPLRYLTDRLYTRLDSFHGWLFHRALISFNSGVLSVLNLISVILWNGE